MPLCLDLRPLGHGEAEVGEDFGELVHDLADGMDGAADALGRRKRKVDFLGRQLALELGGFERSLAVGDRLGDRLAKGVDLRPSALRVSASMEPSDLSSP